MDAAEVDAVATPGGRRDRPAWPSNVDRAVEPAVESGGGHGIRGPGLMPRPLPLAASATTRPTATRALDLARAHRQEGHNHQSSAEVNHCTRPLKFCGRIDRAREDPDSGNVDLELRPSIRRRSREAGQDPRSRPATDPGERRGRVTGRAWRDGPRLTSTEPTGRPRTALALGLCGAALSGPLPLCR